MPWIQARKIRLAVEFDKKLLQTPDGRSHAMPSFFSLCSLYFLPVFDTAIFGHRGIPHSITSSMMAA